MLPAESVKPRQGWKLSEDGENWILKNKDTGKEVITSKARYPQYPEALVEKWGYEWADGYNPSRGEEVDAREEEIAEEAGAASGASVGDGIRGIFDAFVDWARGKP
jgi:hypothetical protein